MSSHDVCVDCGHYREDHHYSPGGGCCVEVDRYERCSCNQFFLSKEDWLNEEISVTLPRRKWQVVATAAADIYEPPIEGDIGECLDIIEAAINADS